MSNDEWRIFVIDRDRNRQGEVDDYVSFKGSVFYRDVGTWQLEIDRSSRHLVNLTTPMYGVEVVNAETEETLLMGPLDERKQKYDPENDTLTVSGWDSNVFLKWRLAHPSPTEQFEPYEIQAYDVRTGQCSSVLGAYVNFNLGPDAIGPRQETPVFSADPGVGTTVTGRARWENLLEFLQSLAASGGDVGFKIVRNGNNIQFFPYQGADKTADIKFSVSLGNLVGGEIGSKSPEATWVYAGGSGEGTARVYREMKDDAAHETWGRREMFLDKSNTNVDSELDQAAREALIEHGEKAEFAIQLVDSPNQVYGVDYFLGDKVTAIFVGSEPVPNLALEGGQVQERVRQVDLVLTEDEQRIIPIIGTPARFDVFRIFRDIRRLRKRMTQVEVK